MSAIAEEKRRVGSNKRKSEEAVILTLLYRERVEELPGTNACESYTSVSGRQMDNLNGHHSHALAVM